MIDASASFNVETYRRLTLELGPDDTAELLGTFLDDTARKMTAISVPDVCRSILQREAHAIKSSAATLGFDRLSTLAFELECTAATAHAEQLRDLADAIQVEFQRSHDLANAGPLLGQGTL